MPGEKSAADELREARAELDNTITEALRHACRVDPYVQTYADFTKQPIAPAPKALQ